MLVDEAVIYVKAGDGGNGAVSFRREVFVPKGGPDGGDGGDGGSVYLVATAGVDTLLDMAGKHHWSAEPGGKGSGKSCTGRAGEDLIIKVPPGTLVHDDESGVLLEDLDASGKKMLAARGGRGGRGNQSFATATRQTPREAQPGELGEERRLKMVLKLIADVGLVGKPNAGKSTLLSRVSRARPKIADYPFTTLEPQLGIAELPGERRLVIADIPGLIEGAHTGAGLGHAFLKHIERTRILVHMLEVEPSDRSDVAENFRAINHELNSHSPVLAEKQQIVVLNKLDLYASEEDRRTAVEMVEAAIGCKVVPISAVSGEGCRELLEACWKMLGK